MLKRKPRARRRRTPGLRPYVRWLLRSRLPRLAFLTALGPGLISGFADNDAGGITTYSVVGAQFGYDLMWVVLASMIALGITQEVGARLGLATGQGFGGLIRQQYGVPRAAFAIGIMLLANLGDTVAEFAGIGAALAIFGVPIWLSSALAALAILFLLSRANFRRIQFVFLGVGIGTSLAYAISAILAHPDWGAALSHTVVPHGSVTSLYLLAVMGTVGTTITPWGQAFIQSYAADKHLGPQDLSASRIDVGAGAFLTNLVAGFIVVACAATLWSHGQVISTAADAARALGPLAGRFAELLFALGLLTASLLGLGTVPLTSAYAVTEAFGWEKGLDRNWRQAPAFYGLLAFFIGFSALFVLIPGLPLIAVMYLSQVFDGLLLPFILVFVMVMSRDRRLLGRLRSGLPLYLAGWLVTGLIILLSLALVVSQIVGTH
ncbi:MAG: divalent metal cation transporter [Candidatus Dormibacteraeota bacterium]|nr:divalent metal cation transporter [Candidatus Dormibacteraeota bacterium]